jgi:hypothetical protein
LRKNKNKNLSIDHEYERTAALEKRIAVTGGIGEEIDLSRAVVDLKGDERTARYVLKICFGGRVEEQSLRGLHFVKHDVFDRSLATP